MLTEIEARTSEEIDMASEESDLAEQRKLFSDSYKTLVAARFAPETPVEAMGMRIRFTTEGKTGLAKAAHIVELLWDLVAYEE